MDSVWVFNGDGNFPSAVFTSRSLAEAWIAGHRLTGVLTNYPLNVGVYEWAIGCGVFKPKRLDQTGPAFVGQFTSASQEHYHYSDGSDDESVDAAEQSGD